MKVYLNNWLFNAGILGYLRIQKLRDKEYDLSKGYLEIRSSDLDGFVEAYFSYALQKMTRSFFKIKALEKVDKYLKDESLTAFKKEIRSHIENRVTTAVKNFNYNDYSKSIHQVTSALTGTEEVIINEIKDHSQKVEAKDREKINKVIKEIISEFEEKKNTLSDDKFTYAVTLLKRFYFNKKIIGQYGFTGKSRKEVFIQEYICPVQAMLDSPVQEGFRCRFVKDARVPLTKFDNTDDFFSEGLFSPIGVSLGFKNFYLNMQSDLILSDLAELIFLCTWAGFTEIPWQFRDEVNNTEFIFLNVPSLELLWDENNKIQSLYDRSKLRLQSTIYEDIIYDLLIKEKQKKSEWALQNLLFVEIRPVSGKQRDKPNFAYFHIDKDISTLFLDDTFANTVSRLRRRIYLRRNEENPNKSTFVYARKAVINRILARDSLIPLARAALHDQLKHSDDYNTSNAFQLSLLEAIRNHFTSKSDNNMDSKQIYGILNNLREQGKKLAKRIDGGEQANKDETINPSSGQETAINKGFEKRKRLSYRLLSLIRTGNSNDFYDALIKLHISNDVSISPAFLNLINSKDEIGFEARAYAFLSGFLGQSDQNQPETSISNTSEN